MTTAATTTADSPCSQHVPTARDVRAVGTCVQQGTCAVFAAVLWRQQQQKKRRRRRAVRVRAREGGLGTCECARARDRRLRARKPTRHRSHRRRPTTTTTFTVGDAAARGPTSRSAVKGGGGLAREWVSNCGRSVVKA